MPEKGQDFLMKTKYNIQILLILLSLLCFSCTNSGSGNSIIDLTTDTIYSPRYASGFVITGDSTARVITVKSPWQGANSVVEQLLVVAENGAIPAGFGGHVLKGTAKRIVCMSSTHVAMLDKLGIANYICGVSGVDFISSPNVVARKKNILDVGYEGNVNYENILAADPDIVLLYGVNGASSMIGKLDEMHIPYIYIGDYLEESPLGKAEWMRAIGELTGKQQEATAELERIATHYFDLCEKVKAAKVNTPTVMVNAPYGDKWMVPPVDSYVARLINDAGGKYLYNNITGNTSVAIDMEDAFLKTSAADIWVNAGGYMSLNELKKSIPKFSATSPVKNKKVYTNNLRMNPSGGNDYYESATVNPDLVLEDLINILHPELTGAEYAPNYYRHLE